LEVIKDIVPGKKRTLNTTIKALSEPCYGLQGQVCHGGRFLTNMQMADNSSRRIRWYKSGCISTLAVDRIDMQEQEVQKKDSEVSAGSMPMLTYP
jgi:hypothetical protein